MLMNRYLTSTGLLLCVFFVFGCSDTKDKNEPDAEDKEESTQSPDENNQGNTDETATDTVDGNSSLNPNDTIENGTDDTATAIKSIDATTGDTAFLFMFFLCKLDLNR